MARHFGLTLLSRRRQRDHSAKAQSHNSAHSHLYNIPEDLLYSIHQYLSSRDSIAIALTCSRFYRSVTFRSIRSGTGSSGEIHFEVLCMLEYDGNIKGHCCRGCMTTHSSATFTCEELTKPPLERYCLRTKKCFRAGPSQKYSFADMQRILGVSQETVPRSCGLLGSLTRSYSPSTIIIENTFPMYPWFHPIHGWKFFVFCRKLNYPFCPHLRMGDIKIIDRFELWADGASKKSSLDCKHCETKVHFERGFSGGEEEWAVFRTCRSIGRLISPLEPAWISQTFASEDPDLKDFWESNERWYIDYWRGQSLSSPSDRIASHTSVFMGLDGPRLFTLPTLPKTWAARIARLHTRVRLNARWPVSTKVYKDFQLRKRNSSET